MTVTVEIPGGESLYLDHLALDLNGTLTNRGALIPGVAERVAALSEQLTVHVLSADTFGTLTALADRLGFRAHVARTALEKEQFVEQLGAERCVAIGNGANDARMLDVSALGIAVIGPEGAAASALHAADVVCGSILDALDVILEKRALVATLRC